MLPIRDKLSYPAGVAPGFDPTHVAAKNPRLSAIALGSGNLVNILKGSAGSPTTITTKIDGNIGPGTVQTASSSNVKFAGNGTVVEGSYTLALMMRAGVFANGGGVGDTVLTSSTGSGGYQIKVNATTHTVGGGIPGVADFPASSIVLSVGVPYFIVISCNTVKAFYVVTNLQTGSVQTSTVAFASGGIAPNGTFGVGGDGTVNGLGAGGVIAAAMLSAVALDLPQLLQWSQDPWSFWYPQKLDLWAMLKSSSAGALFNQAVTVTSSGAVSALKAVTKTTAVASTGVVSILKSIARTIAETCSGAVSLVRSSHRAVALASTGATSVSKSIAKAIAVSSSGAVSFLKAIARKIVLSSVGSVVVSAIKGGANLFNVTVSITSSGAVSLVKNVGKIAAITPSGAVSLAKAISRSIAVAIAGAVSSTAIKVKIVIVSIASSGAVSLHRQVGKVVAIASNGATSAVKAVHRAVTVASVTATSAVKSIAKSILATCAGLANAIAHTGSTVFNVTVSIASSTFTRLLARIVKKANRESLPRTANNSAKLRSNGWPAAPREV